MARTIVFEVEMTWDVLSAEFLDQRHMFALVVCSKLLRGGTGLAVSEDEDGVSHCVWWPLLKRTRLRS